MGILRENDQRTPIRVEEEDADRVINYADYIFDDTDDEVEDEPQKNFSARPQPTYRHRKSHYVSTRFARGVVVDGLTIKRNMGAQKWRRVENARLVASFTDPEDICYDCSDLIPERHSVFSEILTDVEKMKIWNEFIEKQEDEQQRILDEIDITNRLNLEPKTDSKRAKNIGTAKKEKELRAHHPAYSAKSCFERMDKKFKKYLLKSRNLPLKFIANTEEELRAFFSETPSGVYVETLASKVKRFYLHAMAQFLSLKSSTVSESPPNKVIQVTNERDHFTLPDCSLHDLIVNKRKKASFDECSQDL
ncbi:R3H domain-containing protein 4 [Ditylenchus destructor]|uniref:R3H domain-containing protein 4 n=1 Tax=Ditylenchus destructor TaxID=166010 RepID=A0AAD4NCS5_9BILA|nr:R3H domain-containing protein 4 [Ditylenchus destructor]